MTLQKKVFAPGLIWFHVKGGGKFSFLSAVIR